MKYLKNFWIRSIICLFAGGATAELIHISTGDPNRPMENNFTIFYAVIIFILVSIWIRQLK